MSNWVVMRSENDMPLAAETLAALKGQGVAFELIVFDRGSTDGTREEALRHTEHVVDVPPDECTPGLVLNQAMEMTEGEVVAFLDADCTPADAGWLANVHAAFSDVNVAGIFGRQIPGRGCHPLVAKDMEKAFGEGVLEQRLQHGFSMASCGIRRSVWEHRRFNERIWRCEGVEWAWAARKMGYAVLYAPNARAYRSRGGSLAQHYRAQRGEGEAEAQAFEWTMWRRSLPRYTLAPYARQVLGDWMHCLPRLRLISTLYSPVFRGAQALGRRAGFRRGWRGRVGQEDLPAP